MRNHHILVRPERYEFCRPDHICAWLMTFNKRNQWLQCPSITRDVRLSLSCDNVNLRLAGKHNNINTTKRQALQKKAPSRRENAHFRIDESRFGTRAPGRQLNEDGACTTRWKRPIETMKTCLNCRSPGLSRRRKHEIHEIWRDMVEITSGNSVRWKQMVLIDTLRGLRWDWIYRKLQGRTVVSLAAQGRISENPATLPRASCNLPRRCARVVGIWRH